MEIQSSTSNFVEHRKKTIQERYEIIDHTNSHNKNDIGNQKMNNEEQYEAHENLM